MNIKRRACVKLNKIITYKPRIVTVKITILSEYSPVGTLINHSVADRGSTCTYVHG